jgi:hypothetical protein
MTTDDDDQLVPQRHRDTEDGTEDDEGGAGL